VVECEIDGACNYRLAHEARGLCTRNFKQRVGTCAESDGFDFSGIELLSKWAFPTVVDLRSSSDQNSANLEKAERGSGKWQQVR
jgi:hypothetical protein